jgi:hypothetical protein
MKKRQLPTKLPHFDGALLLLPDDRYIERGMCFHKTVGFVLDVPMARLCVGTFRGASPEELAIQPELSPDPFIHCWPEVGSLAFLLNRANLRDRVINRYDKQAYYRQNGTTNVVSMPRSRLLHLSRAYGLAQHLLYHAPLVGDSKFATVILDDLGVSYSISDRGGLVPGV